MSLDEVFPITFELDIEVINADANGVIEGEYLVAWLAATVKPSPNDMEPSR
ncbi:MAG: hypothetical protein PHS96_05225 [Anaerolineales bacterium]|nr:hypothetical protein [Anaerolineales bacterium]